MNLNRIQSWAIGFALLMMVLAGSAASCAVSPETFSMLASFREIVSSAAFVTQDPFAFTPTHSSNLNARWGLGAIAYTFMVLPQWETTGLAILKLLTCFAIGIGCHGLAVRQRVSPTTFAISALLVMSFGIPLGLGAMQPALFSGAALVGLYFLILADRQLGSYWLWGTVPLMTVWANFHEAAILGLIILTTYCLTRISQQCRDLNRQPAQERDLYLWLIPFAAGAATLLNPDGWRLIGLFATQATGQSAWGIDGQPIWHTQSVLVQLLFLVSIALSGYGILVTKPWPSFQSIVLLLTGVFAINYPSYVMLYAVTWICLTPPMIDQSGFLSQVRQFLNRHPAHLAAVSVALGLVALGSAIQNRYWDLRVAEQPLAVAPGDPLYPVSAVDFLAKRSFQGNLLVPETVGGYIAWRLYPQVKVSADSRMQLAYPQPTIAQNRSFFAAQDGWMNQLSRSIDAALIPTQAPVYQALQREMHMSKLNWKPIYQDANFSIFVRSEDELAQRVDADSIETK